MDSVQDVLLKRSKLIAYVFANIALSSIIFLIDFIIQVKIQAFLSSTVFPYDDD